MGTHEQDIDLEDHEAQSEPTPSTSKESPSKNTSRRRAGRSRSVKSRSRKDVTQPDVSHSEPEDDDDNESDSSGSSYSPKKSSRRMPKRKCKSKPSPPKVQQPLRLIAKPANPKASYVVNEAGLRLLGPLTTAAKGTFCPILVRKPDRQSKEDSKAPSVISIQPRPTAATRKPILISAKRPLPDKNAAPQHVKSKSRLVSSSSATKSEPPQTQSGATVLIESKGQLDLHALGLLPAAPDADGTRARSELGLQPSQSCERSQTGETGYKSVAPPKPCFQSAKLDRRKQKLRADDDSAVKIEDDPVKTKHLAALAQSAHRISSLPVARNVMEPRLVSRAVNPKVLCRPRLGLGLPPPTANGLKPLQLPGAVSLPRSGTDAQPTRDVADNSNIMSRLLQAVARPAVEDTDTLEDDDKPGYAGVGDVMDLLRADL